MIEETTVVLIPDRASFARVESALANVGRNAQINLSDGVVSQAREIEGVIAGIDGGIDISINDAGIAEASSKIAALADDLNINLDVDALVEGARAELDALENDGVIDVRARADIEQAVAELASLERDRQTQVTADVRGVAAVEGELERATAPREAIVRAEAVNIAGVDAELDGLAGERREAVIRARADLSGAEVAFNRFVSEAREVDITAGLKRGGRGALGAAAALVTTGGLAQAQASRLAEVNRVASVSEQTGVNVTELDALRRALSVLSPLDTGAILDGLLDFAERGGEELTESLRDPEKVEGGVLGQVPPEALKALNATDSLLERVSILVSVFSQQVAKGEAGRGQATGVAREAFGDEIGDLLVRLAGNPELISQEVARQLGSGNALTPERVEATRTAAQNTRRAALASQDAIDAGLLSDTALTGSNLVSDLIGAAADLASGQGGAERVEQGIFDVSGAIERREAAGQGVPESFRDVLQQLENALAQSQIATIQRETDEARDAIDRVDNPTLADRARSAAGFGRDDRVERAQQESGDLVALLESGRLQAEAMQEVKASIDSLVQIAGSVGLALDRNDPGLGRSN